jgi:hypothetical protein
MRYHVVIQFIALMLGLLLLLNSCAPQALRAALELAPEKLGQRLLQSRQFDTDEQTLLPASTALLQDPGFVVDKASSSLGIASATRLSGPPLFVFLRSAMHMP